MYVIIVCGFLQFKINDKKKKKILASLAGKIKTSTCIDNSKMHGNKAILFLHGQINNGK